MGKTGVFSSEEQVAAKVTSRLNHRRDFFQFQSVARDLPAASQ